MSSITTPIEQRRQKRFDTILDHRSCGYSYVGSHGTCSNYKNSIESKIIIPSGFTNFKNEQLGQRFYVTDSIAVARVFSKHACERRKKDRSLPLIRELNPIVCRIYIKSSTLALLSKTYIPRRVNINHQEVKLWNRDSNIEYYERMLHANPAAIAQAESQVLSTAHGAKTDDSSALPPTVRFSKIQTGEQDPSTFLPDWMPLLGALQSAWPREVLSDMVAKCDILPDIMASTPSSSTTSSSPPSSPDSLNSDSTSFTDFEDSSNSNMLSLQYDELLTFSDAGTVRRNWGRILGASIFKPMVKMGSGTEKVEYMYRNDN
ncbi:hypothetical protein BKA69DRAFT_1129022 [Paraphysoderma sedebokerense]|nr:hypothetical protein BKA69DRAFT_1129022 [Paraphysoderma sedebokerense]